MFDFVLHLIFDAVNLLFDIYNLLFDIVIFVIWFYYLLFDFTIWYLILHFQYLLFDIVISYRYVYSIVFNHEINGLVHVRDTRASVKMSIENSEGSRREARSEVKIIAFGVYWGWFSRLDTCLTGMHMAVASQRCVKFRNDTIYYI